MPQKMNAVIYARYSSQNQREESIEGQLRVCKAFAEQNNLTVVNEYIDRALSGTSAKRPAFQQMISDSSKKQFQVVLIYKIDRFARNTYDSAIYEHKLEENGVKVVSATENVGDGNEALIVKALFRSLAEFYSKQLGQNVKRGMHENALKASSNGGNIPFGYDLVDKKYVLNDQSKYVKMIFEKYAAGKTKTEIVNFLNDKNIKKKNGQPFKMQHITYILNNIRYTGVYKYTDVEVEGGCPAIISKELFERCQQISKLRKSAHGQKKNSENVDFLLFGKLFCGLCGKPMSGNSGTSRTGQTHYYYTCYTRKNKRKLGESCSKLSEKKDFLEWYVVKETVDFVLNDERIEYISSKISESLEKEYSQSSINSLKRELKSIDKEIDAAVDALIRTTSQIAIDKINDKIKLLEIKRNDAELELSKLRLVNSYCFNEDDIKKWLKSFCNGDALSKDFQRHIISAFINSVYLFDDKIIIYYNLKNSKQVTYLEMLEHSEQLSSECSDSNINGSPSWTRTNDPAVNSRMLYRLSY